MHRMNLSKLYIPRGDHRERCGECLNIIAKGELKFKRRGERCMFRFPNVCAFCYYESKRTKSTKVLQ